MDAVLSLEELPNRCPRAPEAQLLGAPLRQLLYGQRSSSFRILFRVYEQPEPVVRVVAIRHGARDYLDTEELDEIE
jgi:plasmid stabilization system protein ParE